MTSDGPLVQVERLRICFTDDGGRELPAVDDVSLTVSGGEAVGLVGESGAGKTLTALSLMGLQPDGARVGGSVRFRGEELVGAPLERLRRVRGGGIGMVFQDPDTALNPVLTVGHQLGEVVRLHGTPEERGRRATRERVVGLLDEVGIPDPGRRIDAYPHQLSGGMRQRVVIAGALAGRPSLLVADEPTTALDTTVQSRILELLRGLRESRGLALLLVSHDLAVVSEVCDRVLVMYAGEVVERGTTPSLLGRPAHPYTRGLLGALPSTGPVRADRLHPIAGSPAVPGSWLDGCRFADRCPRAWSRCATHPPLLDTADGTARCWLVEDPPFQEPVVEDPPFDEPKGGR